MIFVFQGFFVQLPAFSPLVNNLGHSIKTSVGFSVGSPKCKTSHNETSFRLLLL